MKLQERGEGRRNSRTKTRRRRNSESGQSGGETPEEPDGGETPNGEWRRNSEEWKECVGRADSLRRDLPVSWSRMNCSGLGCSGGTWGSRWSCRGREGVSVRWLARGFRRPETRRGRPSERTETRKGRKRGNDESEGDESEENESEEDENEGNDGGRRKVSEERRGGGKQRTERRRS